MVRKRTTRTKAAGKRGTTRVSTRKGKAGDALTLLEEDHKRVQALFHKFERMKDGGSQRLQIVEQACRELDVHAALEEELFYPVIRGKVSNGALVDEAEVEHQSVKQLIARLRSLDPQDPKYGATFKVLAEYVRHHVEEEEGKIFPQVRRSRMDLAGMAMQLQSRKRELMETLGQERPAERAPRQDSSYQEVARH